MLRRILFPAFALSLSVCGVFAAAAGLKDCASDDPNLGIKACTAILELKGQPPLNRAYAHHARGNAYAAEGDLDSAIADYGHALELNPNFVFAYTGRGNAYEAKGDLARAIADYSHAIELDPKFAFAYSGRGHAYKDKGDLDRAMADFSRAIELDPKHAGAHNGRGASFEAKGDFDRAIASYSRAIELDPNFVLAYNGRGNSYKAKGEMDRAIADYNRAIELDPRFTYAYSNRAAAHEASKDFGKALADRAKAAELHAKAQKSLWRLGLSKAFAGDFRGASADLLRSLGVKEAKEAGKVKDEKEAKELTRAAASELPPGHAAATALLQSGMRYASRKTGVSRKWTAGTRGRRWRSHGYERYAEHSDRHRRRHGARTSHRSRRTGWYEEAMNNRVGD